jgi:hypothetical protein
MIKSLRIAANLSLPLDGITHGSLPRIIDYLCDAHVGFSPKEFQSDMLICLPWVEDSRERIWSYINKANTIGCWEWVGSRTLDGYGQVKIKGILRTASRMVFFLENGYLPEVVMHTCDNPPSERLSRGDNHHSRLHPENLAKGERHPQCKNSDKCVMEMRDKFSSGLWTRTELSREYNLSLSQIGRILRGESRA